MSHVSCPWHLKLPEQGGNQSTLDNLHDYSAGFADDIFNMVTKAEVAEELASSPLSQLEQTVLLMAAPDTAP